MLALLTITSLLFSAAGVYLEPSAMAPHLPTVFTTLLLGAKEAASFFSQRNLSQETEKRVEAIVEEYEARFNAGREEILKQLGDVHTKLVHSEEIMFPVGDR